MASNTPEGNKHSTNTRIGHRLAKVLRIKLNRNHGEDEVTRGESVFPMTAADTFVEDEPTSAEWIQCPIPDSRSIIQYFISLFPFLKWITRYNYTWLTGDTVAGITVGAVVIPQSMAYAVLAQLPPEYGLYSSFMGVSLYWFFATSKDIPVAVMSTLIGNIISRVNHHQTTPISPPIIASAIAVICGAIILFIGLIRCGWIVDFVPLIAISAFMTGFAISITIGQVPGLLGITGFNTRDATYKVFINTLKHLGQMKLDAAMGLTALAMLYLIRSFCGYMLNRQPHKHKTWFFMSTLRTVFVISLYTLISWLVNKDVESASKAKFKILGKVPGGFRHAGPPVLTKELIRSFAGELPAAVIVLLIEQIAIAKSFGQANNYTINPSQELVAIGITNILGPFLGAYPVTASFSGTAINSRAGVRTPLAGVIVAIVVLLAMNGLSRVLFFIPRATLSAVIIHAVGNFVTSPDAVYGFWRISPLETVIFFAGVVVTVFTSIENGIYITVFSSAAMLLFRVAKAKGRFLGKVTVYSVVGDHVADEGKCGSLETTGVANSLDRLETRATGRTIFLPMDHRDCSNPEIEVQTPYPGIFIYRFLEGFNYLNANHYLDYLTEYIFKHTRRTTLDTEQELRDRPWSNPGPRRGKPFDQSDDRPTLRALILDFSSVNNIDITSVQTLIDVRNQLDRYTSPDKVQWHFASIKNRWTKRALASAGFGYPTSDIDSASRACWRPVFSVAEIGRSNNTTQDEKYRYSDKDTESKDEEAGNDEIKPRAVVINSVDRPFFHFDLTSALQCVVQNIETTHKVVDGVHATTALDLQEH